MHPSYLLAYGLDSFQWYPFAEVYDPQGWILEPTSKPCLWKISGLRTPCVSSSWILLYFGDWIHVRSCLHFSYILMVLASIPRLFVRAPSLPTLSSIYSLQMTLSTGLIAPGVCIYKLEGDGMDYAWPIDVFQEIGARNVFKMHQLINNVLKNGDSYPLVLLHISTNLLASYGVRDITVSRASARLLPCISPSCVFLLAADRFGCQ